MFKYFIKQNTRMCICSYCARYIKTFNVNLSNYYGKSTKMFNKISNVYKVDRIFILS